MGRLGLAALTVVATLSCSASSPEQPPDAATSCFVGDPAAAPEIGMVYLTADGTIQPVDDMTSLPLLDAPQGGKQMLVGVQARNLDGCPLTVTAALMDESGTVIALERRPVTLVPTGDGLLIPKQAGRSSNYSNIPACPRAGLAQPIDGVTYQLKLMAEDSAGRQAEVSRMVVPTCADAATYSQCTCICSDGYKLGDRCM